VDVDAECLAGRVLALRRPAEQLLGEQHGHAELGVVMPGLDVDVGGDLHVGVDPDGEAGPPPGPGRDPLQQVQLVGRFHVHHHAVLDGQRQLGLGLADAGENHQARIGARPQDPHQLTAADHVEAGAHAGQAAQQGEVGVGLDRVEPAPADGGGGGGEPPPGSRDPVEVVDVGGRAGAGHHLVERQAAGAQYAVDVGERG
jgi:hypothetical protein